MGFSRFGSSGEIRTSWAYHISAKSINSDFWLWRSGFFHFKSRHPFLLLPNGPPALPTYSRILTYIDLWYYCVYEYFICIWLKSNKSISFFWYSLVQIRLKNIDYWALLPWERCCHISRLPSALNPSDQELRQHLSLTERGL